MTERHGWPWGRAVVLSILVSFVMGSVALAQAVRPRNAGTGGAADEVVKVKKFNGVGRAIIERTPEFKSSTQRSAGKPPGEWAQITVVYDTDLPWIDELVFQYYVMTVMTEEGKKLYSFYKTRATYMDVQEGRGHMSAVYLRPNALKRHGQVVAAAYEILYKGKVIAEGSQTDFKLPEKWWTKPEVVDNKDVITRDGYLVERSQTPFSLINIDDNEVAK